MNLTIVLQAIESFRNYSITELLEYHQITLIEEEQLPNKTDAMIINMKFLFLKKQLHDSYRNFLILHELGHCILHYDKHINFNFSIRVKKNKLEKEANTFACLFLLKEEVTENINIINLLQSKGVPEKIALQFYDDLKP